MIAFPMDGGRSSVIAQATKPQTLGKYFPHLSTFVHFMALRHRF
jgi:hypothetical protein